MTATLLMLGLKSLLIAALALGALRLTRKRSAAERSTIAHLGLFALVALPLASLLLPSLSVALPQSLASQPAPISMPAEMPAPAMAVAGPVIAAHEAAPPRVETPSIAARAADLARYAYLLPAAALLMLTLIALVRLIGLRSRAQVVVDAHWLGALGRAQHRMGFKNGTALLTSSDLRSPISWGLLRPTILVNESALAASDQAEAIIAHELAHVIQLDWAKLMLSRVATAVFWFNPLAWVLAREAHQLREEAADDAVLASDVAGTDYAQLLVGIARHENRGLLLGAHGVAPAKNSLHRRVARVLDKTPARGPSGPSWVAGFTAGMMVMAVPLAAVSFGPARAKDDPAAALPTAKAAPAAKSWSVRADDPVNKPAEAPRDPAGQELAFAGRAPRKAAADVAPPARDDDSWPIVSVPDMSGFADAWSRAGAAIGERYSRMFGGAPAAPGAPAIPAVQAAPAAPAVPRFDFNISGGRGYNERDMDAMLGVNDDFRKEMASAGFPNATRGELLQARTMGLTGERITALRAAGITGSLGTFAQAQGVGLTPDYVQGLRDAGITGSVTDYIRARSMGLTGDYVRALNEAGLKGSLNDYVHARAVGLAPSYVRSMAAVGVQASFSEYEQLQMLGISSAYVQALHRNGNMVVDPSHLIELRTYGYRPKDQHGGDP